MGEYDYETEEFDWKPPLIGGIAISLATSLNLYLKGRITGWSGIFNGLVTWDKKGLNWKSSSIAGLVFSACFFWLMWNDREVAGTHLFPSTFSYVSDLDVFGWIIGGLLVGLGTKIGNGCTSGHGVCGLPRFGLRSIVAVGTFMFVAALIANLRFYLPFFDDAVLVNEALNADHNLEAKIFAGLTIVVLLFNIIRNRQEKSDIWDALISFTTAFIFGFGLLYSGMADRNVVLGFFHFGEYWNPSLMFVFIGALVPNLFTFRYIIHYKKESALGDKLDIPEKKDIDILLLGGAALFGLGWGLTGICPGPAIVAAPLYNPHVLGLFIPALALGQWVGGKLVMLYMARQGFQMFEDAAEKA